MRKYTCFLGIVVAVGAGFLAGCAASRSGPPTVAMVTDYGSTDAYVGVLSAAIIHRCPEVRLVTVTHEISDYDIRAGSFVLGVAAPAFDPEVVFCVVVDPGVGTTRRSIIARTKRGRRLVGPDNGLFTDILGIEGLDAAWSIDERSFNPTASLSSTFHGRDIYGPVSGMLAAGADPSGFGPPIQDPVRFEIPEASRAGGSLRGVIRYVDGYGNLLTNIPAGWVESAAFSGKSPGMLAVGDQRLTCKFGRTYADVPGGDFVVLENSIGLLEVARNGGSAADAFGEGLLGTEVRVDTVVSLCPN